MNKISQSSLKFILSIVVLSWLSACESETNNSTDEEQNQVGNEEQNQAGNEEQNQAGNEEQNQAGNEEQNQAGNEEQNQAGEIPSTSNAITDISGAYEVTQVTCGGEEESISVTAIVTFDQNSYLEEWSFEGSECKISLAGRLDQSAETLTLVDVMVSCNDVCTAQGIPCHSDPCSNDQEYQYNLQDSELLMSFTQNGDEFACGPCGNGVDGTYLLTRIAQ